MKKAKVVFDFIPLTIPEKIVKGRNVYSEMNENPTFPNPDIPMDDLRNVNDTLESRFLAGRTGGKESTVMLHQVEEQWNNTMRILARYAERIAGNDPAIILSAGFNLAKQPIPAQRAEFSVESGKTSGSVVLRRQAVPGAKAYIWQYCMNQVPSGDEGWTIAEVTVRASVELTKLYPVTKYWFRVAVVSAQGTSAYNDPILHVVS